MQRFQILKHTFTGLTPNETIHYGVADSVDNVPIIEIPGTKLQFINNYYSYSSELGINIVNDTNVRDYLDDEKNLSLSMQFIDHLHNSTQIEE